MRHSPLPRANFAGMDVELVVAHAQAITDVYFMDFTTRFKNKFGQEYIRRVMDREELDEDKRRWAKELSQELVIEKMKYSVENQLFGALKEFANGLGEGVGTAAVTAAFG